MLRALLDLVDFKSGRLEPTYAKLISMTGFAKSTIGSALNRLRAHGFLDWVRRSHLVEADDVVAREQTSNAYFFDFARMPRRAYLRFRQLLARRERTSEAPAAAPPPSVAPTSAADADDLITTTDPLMRSILLKLQASVNRGAE